MKRIAVTLVALIALVTVGPPATVTAQSNESVSIGVIASLTMTPFYLADELGYFRDEGLNVTFVPFASAAQMVAPLAAGQLDVGGGAISAGLYNAVGRGLDVRAVADLGSDPAQYGFQKLIIRSDLVKSGRYKSAKDLRGLTLAITAPGISTSALVSELIKKAGLRMSDIKLDYLGNPDQLVALRNGSLDGSFMPEPNATIASRTGAAVIELGADTFYPNQQIAVTLFGASLLKSRRETGQKFMRAYIRAARYYSDALRAGKVSGPSTTEIYKVFARESNVSDRAILAAVTPNWVDPNGRLNIASMKKDITFFAQAGLLETNVQPEDAIDASFAADAVRGLGPYKSSP